jgi:hypothetical protein
MEHLLRKADELIAEVNENEPYYKMGQKLLQKAYYNSDKSKVLWECYSKKECGVIEFDLNVHGQISSIGFNNIVNEIKQEMKEKESKDEQRDS